MTADVERIVSSESEALILVDEHDNETGSMSKARCHDGDGVLHRAFSLFIFNSDGHVLLQQRSSAKRLWPLYWSNSCCSHPRIGESMTQATERRSLQELGIRAELEFVYKFSYHAGFEGLGSERELCSVFLGRTSQSPDVNPTEIVASRFVSAEQLTNELAASPDAYTPWLRMEWITLNERFAGTLAGYSGTSAPS